MGFIYYCSQRAEIFLLALWNNRLFQQSGSSRDVQLRNRRLFSSSSDPAWGVWWPQIGHLPGQNQGTMLRAAHRLFGRGGASWSKNICYEMAKKKKSILRLIISHLPATGTVRPINKFVWCEAPQLLHEKCLCICSYPGQIPPQPSRTHSGSSDLDSWRKWTHCGFTPRFIPQLVICLSNTTSDKGRRASARKLHGFPISFYFLLLMVTVAGLPADCTDITSGTPHAKLNMGKVL